MELDFSQMALEVSHHGYLLVTHLTTQEHCCHTSFHVYWYMNVMRSSRLFRVSLFLENDSILMIWGCFSIVSNVIRSNYCCRRHTMHGNMVFSRDSIFPTPTTKRMFMCVQRSDQYATFIFLEFVHKMAAGGHFEWPKITFYRISRHLRSMRNFDFFVHKMAAGGHFGWPKIAFDHISRHLRSIRNFFFF